MNGFGPAHIEKSHFKGIFGCIFRQSLMKYEGNKSIKEKSSRPWVLFPEDKTLDGHPKDSIVLRRARHHLLHALLKFIDFYL